MEFEKAWGEYTKVPFCKTYSSGAASLTSMLFALDLPPGSEILVADDSSWWPVVPMRFFGLFPVGVDIVYLDSTTLNFSWDRTINQPKDDCRLEIWAIRSLDGGQTWIDRQRILEGYNPRGRQSRAGQSAVGFFRR